MESLKSLDFYPKLAEEARVKTFTGAAVSLVALSLMVVLFISQFFAYQHTEFVDHLVVDTERGLDFQVNFDMSFPHTPCDLLDLEIIDVASKQLLDLQSSFQKQDILPQGGLNAEYKKYSLGESVAMYGGNSDSMSYKPDSCGNCGVTGKSSCCNSCQDVLNAYESARQPRPSLASFPQCAAEYQSELKMQLQNKQGCRFYGFYFTRRVAGQFKIVPGHHRKMAGAVQTLTRPGSNIEDVNINMLDLTHKFDILRFGDVTEQFVTPLRGVSATSKHPASMFLYYTKVIPTTLKPLRGKVTESNQYSVTEHTKTIEPSGLRSQSPGVYVAYEHSPIRIIKEEVRQPFLTFLTQVCAIVGGVFAIAGFIDKILYSSVKHAAHKLELGKNY